MKACRSPFAGLLAPTFLKKAVDALSGTITQAAVNACVAALAWSGFCRVINSVAREAQGPIFTPVAQVGLCPIWDTSRLVPYGPAFAAIS